MTDTEPMQPAPIQPAQPACCATDSPPVAEREPCCGTAAEAVAEASCCGRTAKARLVAAGADCCA